MYKYLSVKKEKEKYMIYATNLFKIIIILIIIIIIVQYCSNRKKKTARGIFLKFYFSVRITFSTEATYLYTIYIRMYNIFANRVPRTSDALQACKRFHLAKVLL